MIRLAIPDVISPSYFPVIAAVELGFLERAGLETSVELIYPVADTYRALRDGTIDYVGGAAHASLYVFGDWDGAALLCALSQHMYWFLVVRSDLGARRGDLRSTKGLRIGAALGPVDGLRRMLREAGIDPDADVEIGPVPGTAGAGVSFGVTAAQALKDGRIDGFWANGMGAEVAVRDGVGTVLIDARRGDGTEGARDYTFAALVTTRQRVEIDPAQALAVTRAVVAAQRALREDPERAAAAAAPHFPEEERGLIAELVRRDAPFYDPAIPPAKVAALNHFAADLGLLSPPAGGYDDVVARSVKGAWQ